MIKDPEVLVDAIVTAMRKQAKEAYTDKAEIDISGGIDSAVVAALSCLAFGPENVIGVFSGINSSVKSHRRARMTADKFGFHYLHLHLTGAYNVIIKEVKRAMESAGLDWPDEKENPMAFGGFRSCLRAPVGRFVNRMFGGGIRQGTGNRDEDELIRFYQKGGDGEVDCNWIGGLFKSEVWELAAHLDVPQEIIDAKPTPDLWGAGETHNDEDELKELTGVDLTYGRPSGEMGTIEWVIRENDKNGCVTGDHPVNWGRNSVKTVVLPEYTNEQWKIIEAVREMEQMTRHKAELPPILERQFLVDIGAVK